MIYYGTEHYGDNTHAYSDHTAAGLYEAAAAEREQWSEPVDERDSLGHYANAAINAWLFAPDPDQMPYYEDI